MMHPEMEAEAEPCRAYRTPKVNAAKALCFVFVVTVRIPFRKSADHGNVRLLLATMNEVAYLLSS